MRRFLFLLLALFFCTEKGAVRKVKSEAVMDSESVKIKAVRDIPVKGETVLDPIGMLTPFPAMGEPPEKKIHNYSIDILLSNNSNEKKWVVLSLDKDAGAECFSSSSCIRIDQVEFKENESIKFMQITCKQCSCAAFFIGAGASLDISNFQPFLITLGRAEKMYVLEASEILLGGSPIPAEPVVGTVEIKNGSSFTLSGIGEISEKKELHIETLRRVTLDLNWGL